MAFAMGFAVAAMFTTAYVILSHLYVNDDDASPFWINPCGYPTNDGMDVDDDPYATINRVLTLADQCQIHSDRFKYDYVRTTFPGENYTTHYGRWVNQQNAWMVPRLLDQPDDELSEQWMNKRRYPDELIVTYSVLQRAAVGLELLLDDAADVYKAESAFAADFAGCRTCLRQLLCEVYDDVDADDQLRDQRPADVGRDVIPNEVRLNDNTAERNLVNSIIFRDYMVAVQYVKTLYKYFLSRMAKLNGHDQ